MTSLQSPPNEIALPSSIMDFLDSSTLDALLSPAILDGSNGLAAGNGNGSAFPFGVGKIDGDTGGGDDDRYGQGGAGPSHSRNRSSIVGVTGGLASMSASAPDSTANTPNPNQPEFFDFDLENFGLGSSSQIVDSGDGLQNYGNYQGHQRHQQNYVQMYTAGGGIGSGNGNGMEGSPSGPFSPVMSNASAAGGNGSNLPSPAHNNGGNGSGRRSAGKSTPMVRDFGSSGHGANQGQQQQGGGSRRMLNMIPEGKEQGNGSGNGNIGAAGQGDDWSMNGMLLDMGLRGGEGSGNVGGDGGMTDGEIDLLTSQDLQKQFPLPRPGRGGAVKGVRETKPFPGQGCGADVMRSFLLPFPHRSLRIASFSYSIPTYPSLMAYYGHSRSPADWTGSLVKQLEQIHMQSPALFAHLASQAQAQSQGQGQGQGQGQYPASRSYPNLPNFYPPFPIPHSQAEPNACAGPGPSSRGSQQENSSTPGGYRYGAVPPPMQAGNVGRQNGGDYQGGSVMMDGKRMFAATNGIMTPAQSSEMLANIHNGLVSPLPMTERMGELEGEYTINSKGEIVFTPLLSPAITQAANSQHASPQFNPQFGMTNLPSSALTNQSPNLDQQAQLQALQQQQMNIQRQLDEIQRQQHQSQASPYVSPMISGTPNVNGGFIVPGPSTHAGNRSGSTGHPTPTSEFFSPLTSPALNPTQAMHRQHRAHSRESLSALSSPSSANGSRNFGGSMLRNQNGDMGNVPLQQTMSPALLPQPDAWRQTAPQQGLGLMGSADANNSSSQAYLAELARMLGSAEGADNVGPVMQDAVMQIEQMSDGRGQTSSTGAGQRASKIGKSPSLRPHRSSTGKTRPSPMMKPLNRPGRAGSNTVPPSPLVEAHTAAEYNGFKVPQLEQTYAEGSAGSGSLSPVDLSQVLVPAPAPVSTSNRAVNKGKIAPITPATLMQMKGNSEQSVRGRKASIAEEQEEGGGRVTRSKGSTSGGFEDDLTPLGTPRLGKQGLADQDKPSTLSPKNWSASLKALKPIAKSAKSSKSAKAQDAKAALEPVIAPEIKKSSHKAAEQRRRDSLKAGFDELRLLLPPINTEALDPETGEPIPGSSAPRLLPKSSLVPDDNPNKGVSKVALLKYSNEYIERIQGRLERRNNYIDLLKDAIQSIRSQAGMSPDEQVDELLQYAFEDEDEDEEPTGASMARAKRQAEAEAEENDELGEDEQMEEADLKPSKRGGKSARGKKKPTATNNSARQTKAAAKRKSIAQSDDSSLETSPMLHASIGIAMDETMEMDTT